MPPVPTHCARWPHVMQQLIKNPSEARLPQAICQSRGELSVPEPSGHGLGRSLCLSHRWCGLEPSLGWRHLGVHMGLWHHHPASNPTEFGRRAFRWCWARSCTCKAHHPRAAERPPKFPLPALSQAAQDLGMSEPASSTHTCGMQRRRTRPLLQLYLKSR